jgi:hypothetical protein
MASIARQPFAALDGARLQSLASTKNRQNGAILSSPKRKAAGDFDIFDDDAENQKPLPTKRAKNSAMASPKDALRVTTANAAAAPTPRKLHKPATSSSLATCTPAPSTPPKKSLSRAVLEPKSPSARLAGGSKAAAAAAAPAPKPASLAIPAGRSPPRAKRTTLLKQQARGVAQPAFGRSAKLGGGAAAPFSLDAALKGTISSATSSRSVGAHQAKASLSSIFSSAPGGRSSTTAITFDIYEDTPEQEMTNLLQHSTCVLDISSDDEAENKGLMDKADGVDKENVPPADDASQLSRPASPARRSADEMELVKERRALGDLVAADFYAEGTDSSSVFMVPADEDEVKGAAEPKVDKFELWESASADGDDEAETDVE